MIYYGKCTQSDWPQLVAMAKALGLVQETETGQLVGQGWVYVGPVTRPTGNTLVVGGLEVPETASVLDTNGNPYVHVNLVYEGSLRALAESKAQDHPEIAEALQNLSRWFVTDEDGNHRAPTNPYNVIFGVQPQEEV